MITKIIFRYMLVFSVLMFSLQLNAQNPKTKQTVKQETKAQKLKAQQLKEQQLKEQQLKEQQLKEQQLKEQQLKEQQLKEQQLKDEQLKAQKLKEKTQNGQLTKEEIAAYMLQAKELILFYEGTLNFLAGEEGVTKEKEIIINESFDKIFANDKVQIEDDLDENRKTFINKDVQAYLKDVDFFLNNAQFLFTVEEITLNQNEKNEPYFKVTTTCRLKGVTIAKDTVNVVKKRYFEININDANQDLKIASIYTTKLNEDEDLQNWWKSLSEDWKKLLSAVIPVADPPTYEQLKKIVSLDRIDFPGRKITNIDPLDRLTQLKKIDLGQNMITTLYPLRNLAKLEQLDCAENQITSLEPLKYSTKLVNLDCSSNKISSIGEIINFEKLEVLNFSGNAVSDIKPLSETSKLKDLRLLNTLATDISSIKDLKFLSTLIISGSKISDLNSLVGLSEITRLELDNTQVANISVLKSFTKLTEVSLNSTQVSSLDDLGNLGNLKKIYCDNTLISKDKANLYMQLHPSTLVIYASETLAIWWRNLPQPWKNVFASKVKILDLAAPTKEELHQIANISKIDVSGNKSIKSIGPLKLLRNLQEISISNTEISTIDSLSELTELKTLNISYSKVNSLDPLKKVMTLEILNCQNTSVASLDPLLELKNMKTLFADSTLIPKQNTQNFIDKYPSCLVIYQTKELTDWWSNLPDGWKKVFGMYVKTNGNLSKEQLQNVADLESITIGEGTKIKNLEPVFW